MFPTGLPSITRLKAKFDPKFAGLRTIKRPAGRARRAAAVSMEAAQRKTRIRKSVVTDVNLDFMPSCFLGIRFWPAWRVHPNDRHRTGAHRRSDQGRDDLCARGLRKRAYHLLVPAASTYLVQDHRSRLGIVTSGGAHSALRRPAQSELVRAFREMEMDGCGLAWGDMHQEGIAFGSDGISRKVLNLDVNV